MRRNKFLVLALLAGITSTGFTKDKEKKSTWFQTIGNVPDSKEAAPVAGVRGLEEIDEEDIVGSEARDYAALEELEAVKIEDAAQQAFVAEGKLK